jgi:hypothetical protein
MPVRYVLAGLLLLAVLRLFGWSSDTRLGRADLVALAGPGVVGITVNYVGYTVGLSLTSVSNAALIIATAPVWGLLLGVVLGLERGSWMGALGLGLAIAGPSWWAGDWDLRRRPWGRPARVRERPLLGRLHGALPARPAPPRPPLVVGAWTMLLGGLAALP